MRSKKEVLESPKSLSVWNCYDFLMAGVGRKCTVLARIQHAVCCLKYSYQRIVRGYSDDDVWQMNDYMQKLVPKMVHELKEIRIGSPGVLGMNYVDDDGFYTNDKCHEEWDAILDRIVFLFQEMNEETCSRQNEYESEHLKMFEEFEEKYGLLGEKLQTEEELAKSEKTHAYRVHFMNEIPEYRDLDEKYRQRDAELAKYRESCKDEAFDLLKKWFFWLQG